jgi:hypothetical protein
VQAKRANRLTRIRRIARRAIKRHAVVGAINGAMSEGSPIKEHERRIARSPEY